MNETLKIIAVGVGVVIAVVLWLNFGLWLITRIVHKMNERSKARLKKKLEEEYKERGGKCGEKIKR